MQFKVVQETVFSNTDIITPLRLSINFSWQVVAQSLTNSLKNGIIGLGLDSFGVVFTALKPISLINYDFLSAYNEVLTSLSNLGFLWLVIWLILGWYTLKDLIKDIKEYDKNLNVVILFDVLIFFLYLTSFLATYTALLRFLFFFMITMGVILRNMYKHHEVENVILKIWSMNTSQKSESNSSIASIFFTVLIVIVVLLGILKLGSMTISSLYLLRAESYISEQNKNYSEQAPVLEEEEEIVENLYRWYSLALTYDKNNPLTNKKFSAAAIDRLSILMEKYEDSDDEDILNEAVNLRKQAFEYSRNAINLSPSLYSNYNNRVQVYLGVINLGYREYIRDAISVINEAININPYDYQNYYNKAWLYYLLQNYDLALEASTQSLSIKPDYIQALLLSANINGIKGKKEIQLSYLEAIKTILEENDYQDTELYNNLVDQMESIESEDTNDSEDVPETEQ
jgi:tetratricopeptide (TPR) repeat protein